ncbi:MAG: hypothetical protein E7401_03945 [Ruminococcaceae bacterium]|nr:hypothetical protein [Oscillospiraceae bacterium]
MRLNRIYKGPSVISLLWKLVVIVFASIGVYLQAKLDGGLFKTYVFLYFTIFSNMGIAIISGLLVVLGIFEKVTRRRLTPHWLLVLRFMFVTAMTVTLVVSLALLAPFKSQAYLFSLRNLSVHIFAPLAAVIDFIVFDKQFKCRMWSCCLGFVIPAAYLVVTLLISIKGITYSNGSNFPYYFLDYRTLGWTTFEDGKIGVLWWILLIGGIVFVISFLLTAIKVIINKLRNKRHP